VIAQHHAQRIVAAFSHLSSITVIDAFAGVGGNTIALACHPRISHVIAIDIDETRLSYAKHNARVYQCLDKIEFIQGDALLLLPSLQLML